MGFDGGGPAPNDGAAQTQIQSRSRRGLETDYEEV